MTGGKLEEYLRDNIIALLAEDQASESPMVSPALSGGVYYKGMRPMQNEQDAANKEDVVVAVISGNEEQLQKGSCVVNIYIPDTITASGAAMRTKERTDQLEAWAVKVPKLLSRRGDILFEKSGMVITLKEEGIKEHFVSLKMDFTLLNENFD
jgi:hypothetical protein